MMVFIDLLFGFSNARFLPGELDSFFSRRRAKAAAVSVALLFNEFLRCQKCEMQVVVRRQTKLARRLPQGQRENESLA
jgi:hypothetical protein